MKVSDFEARGVGDPAVSGSAELSGVVTPFPVNGSAGTTATPTASAAPVPSAPSPEDLLAFESSAPHHPSEKARACRERFGFGLVRYYKLLHRAARDPRGLVADPMTALRIRRLLEQRRRMRLGGHLKVFDADATQPCGWCDGSGLLAISPTRSVTCRRCEGSGVVFG
jgi:hypothetical protein